MTDSTEPREGWYLAQRESQNDWTAVYLRGDGRWVFERIIVGECLPIGWTLGPRLDDLLRDAARWRYVIEELSPEDFATIDAEDLGEWIDAEIAREGGR